MRRLLRPLLRAVMMTVAAGLLLSQQGPLQAVEAPAAALVPLERAEVSAPLSSSYGLPVVEMPPPPFGALSDDAPALADGCPVELRAVVVGAEVDDQFAIVVVGEETEVVRAGARVSTPYGRLTVTRLERGRIKLAGDGIVYTCSLAK